MSSVLTKERPGLVERSTATALTVEEVYRLHGPTVARWALRLGGPRMDLDDVVQDVFLKVQTNLGNFRGEAQLTTWLFQVTRNVVGHRRRKDRVRRWLAGTGTEVAGELACPALEPLAKVERRQSAEMLYRARAQLSRQLQQMSVTEEAR